jgi:hypothetical protein
VIKGCVLDDELVQVRSKFISRRCLPSLRRQKNLFRCRDNDQGAVVMLIQISEELGFGLRKQGKCIMEKSTRLDMGHDCHLRHQCGTPDIRNVMSLGTWVGRNLMI